MTNDPLRAALEDLSKMAFETSDPDPAYRRAYADIAKYVREEAQAALASADGDRIDLVTEINITVRDELIPRIARQKRLGESLETCIAELIEMSVIRLETDALNRRRERIAQQSKEDLHKRQREFLCHLKGWSEPWHKLTDDQRAEIDRLVAGLPDSLIIADRKP